MIIIPTYNEQKNIRRLVERIRQAIGDIPVLFVDDNSPDGTSSEIAAMRLHDPNISLLQRQKREGLGPAYRNAFVEILRTPVSDFVITMDADLSHDTAELPRIMELIKHYPVVVGSRYVPGGKIVGWNRFRLLISYAGNLYAKLLTRVPVSDLTSGYVAYRLEWLKKIPLNHSRSRGYAFQIEMKYLLHKLGAPLYEHPITFFEREGGKSKFSMAIVFEGFWYPLKIFLKNLF